MFDNGDIAVVSILGILYTNVAGDDPIVRSEKLSRALERRSLAGMMRSSILAMARLKNS